jgi:hypothetical protein
VVTQDASDVLGSDLDQPRSDCSRARELGLDVPPALRVAAAFTELALAI